MIAPVKQARGRQTNSALVCQPVSFGLDRPASAGAVGPVQEAMTMVAVPPDGGEVDRGAALPPLTEGGWQRHIPLPVH